MRSEKFSDFKQEEHYRSHKGKGHHRGPKTFRRRRAIAFLEMMNLKRSTIKQQLEEPEFQSIQQILVGELKAIDLVINEFSQLFEIHESEVVETSNKGNEVVSKECLDHDEKGMDSNETN